MKEKWMSVVEWPRGEVSLGNAKNQSTDTHRSYAEAFNIVQILIAQGFGCEGRIFPVNAYVKEIK